MSQTDSTENRSAAHALREALNELGVPDETYPAPVANAVDLIRQALAILAAEEPAEYPDAEGLAVLREQTAEEPAEGLRPDPAGDAPQRLDPEQAAYDRGWMAGVLHERAARPTPPHEGLLALDPSMTVEQEIAGRIEVNAAALRAVLAGGEDASS